MTLIAYLKNTNIYLFASLIFLMLLTRGDHLLSSISLPDASFALFLIGGMLLTKPKWFISLFILSVVIDLATLSINFPTSHWIYSGANFPGHRFGSGPNP